MINITELAPLLGYYGFLFSMFGFGLFFIYGIRYLKKKRNIKDSDFEEKNKN